jgi:hypothetical protein
LGLEECFDVGGCKFEAKLGGFEGFAFTLVGEEESGSLCEFVLFKFSLLFDGGFFFKGGAGGLEFAKFGEIAVVGALEGWRRHRKAGRSRFRLLV